MTTYTREEAVAWMANGHKARPPTWSVGHIRTHFGMYRDELLARVHETTVLSGKWDTGWRLLGKARMGREAKLAAALAEIARLAGALDYERKRHMEHCRELDMTRDSNTELLATIARLEAELAISQELCGVRERKNQALKAKFADALDTLARLSPAPEAPAVPVEVWHACSASEARERHAAGMRVRSDGWVGTLRQCKHTSDNFRWQACEQLLRDTGKAGWAWAWSEPLAETVSP